MMNFCRTAAASVIKSRPVKNFMDDLSSLRALWCWITLLLFVAMSGYIMVHSPASHNTLIMTWGTLVGAIFTNYVFSNSTEKVVKMLRKPPVEAPKNPNAGVEDEPDA